MTLTLLSYNSRIYQHKFKFQQTFLTNENQKHTLYDPIKSQTVLCTKKLLRQIIVDILVRIL